MTIKVRSVADPHYAAGRIGRVGAALSSAQGGQVSSLSVHPESGGLHDWVGQGEIVKAGNQSLSDSSKALLPSVAQTMFWISIMPLPNSRERKG